MKEPLVNGLTPRVDSQKSKLVRILRKCRGSKQGLSERALPKFAGAQCTLRTIPTQALLLLRDSGSCPHIVHIILVFARRVMKFSCLCAVTFENFNNFEDFSVNCQQRLSSEILVEECCYLGFGAVQIIRSKVFDWLSLRFCHLIFAAKGSIKVSNAAVVSSCFSHEWTCV